MEGVLPFLVDLVDVDRVIMGSNGEVLLVWRISEALTPFSWLVKSGDSLAEIIVVKKSDVTVVVADGNMVPLW